MDDFDPLEPNRTAQATVLLVCFCLAALVMYCCFGEDGLRWLGL